MEKRVTYRTSPETIERLRELSDKYGVSQSALLTLLVNERWLQERLQGTSPEEGVMSEAADRSVSQNEEPFDALQGLDVPSQLQGIQGVSQRQQPSTVLQGLNVPFQAQGKKKRKRQRH